MASETQRKTKAQRNDEGKRQRGTLIERPEMRVVMPSRYSTVIWLIPIFINLVMLQRAINHTKKRMMRTGSRMMERVHTETERLSALKSLKR